MPNRSIDNSIFRKGHFPILLTRQQALILSLVTAQQPYITNAEFLAYRRSFYLWMRRSRPMSSTSSMFAQLLQQIPMPTFKHIVREEKGEQDAKGFTCRMQLVAMLYLWNSRFRQHQAG